jgi:hypothetical protein
MCAPILRRDVAQLSRREICPDGKGLPVGVCVLLHTKQTARHFDATLLISLRVLLYFLLKSAIILQGLE